MWSSGENGKSKEKDENRSEEIKGEDEGEIWQRKKGEWLWC